MLMRVRRLLPAALLSMFVTAQAHNGYSFLRAGTGVVDYRETVMEALQPCTAASLPLPEGAQLRSTVGVDVEGRRVCRAEYLLLGRIRVEVNLPLAWNGRLYMHGNGGFAGQFTDSFWTARVRDDALANGFATVTTDTGHDQGEFRDARFAIDEVALVDYAHRAVHLTAQHARDVIAGFYGTPPRHSYFDGCSNGGRQALIEAQRYPEDFDGILAGAPWLDQVGQSLAYAWRYQALEGVEPFTAEQLELLASRVYASCPLTDGLITDPRACRFDAATELPICTDGSEPCFTPRQRDALARIYAGPNVGGRQLYPGPLPGPEKVGRMQSWSDATWREASGWEWLLAEDRDAAFAGTRSYFRYIAFGRSRPELELGDIDFAEDPPKLAERSSLMNATSTDLDGFRARGGKLLGWFGWADQSLNPMAMLTYRDAVAARYGEDGSQDFFRLFMLPGVFHCHSGVGPDEFDGMTALIDWVERGVAPESIPLTGPSGADRPSRIDVCAWPGCKDTP